MEGEGGIFNDSAYSWFPRVVIERMTASLALRLASGVGASMKALGMSCSTH